MMNPGTTLRTIFLFAGVVIFTFTSYSQQKKYVITNNHLKNTHTQTNNPGWESIYFKNIDVIQYYHDEKKLKEISKTEKANSFEKLLPLLEDYVGSYGTDNFGHEYELMWKLAQLYEKTGKVEVAKYLYRIILKHTDENIEFIWQYYDNLSENDKDDYVPIDYYYELVEYRKQIDTLRPPRGVFINMGETVNSNYEDYGPSLNISNNKLLFTSKRNRLKDMGKEVVNEDIFWANRVDENTWEKAQSFEGINTYYNEGSPCLSRDGSTLYFIRCEAPGGFTPDEIQS